MRTSHIQSDLARIQNELKHDHDALVNMNDNLFSFTQEEVAQPSSCSGGKTLSRMPPEDSFQAMPTHSSRYAPGNEDISSHLGLYCQPTTNKNLLDTTPALDSHPQDQYYRGDENDPSVGAFPMTSFHPVAEHVHSQQWDQIYNNNRSAVTNHAQTRHMQSPSSYHAPQEHGDGNFYRDNFNSRQNHCQRSNIPITSSYFTRLHDQQQHGFESSPLQINPHLLPKIDPDILRFFFDVGNE